MCNPCLPPSLFPRIAKGEMQRARKWQAVLAISFLLVTSSVQGISEAQSGERRTLLDLIVQVIGDSSTSRESGKVITRRYSEGTAYSTEHGGNHRLSSRERTSPRTSSKRPSETFSSDFNLKEKFLNHLTGALRATHLTPEDTIPSHPWSPLRTAGRVVVSAECRMQFYRLYHNTKDCSIPALYMRCCKDANTVG
ncbi:ALK and LTK ligand 1 isoform X1 [Bufo bufo]|uniref:ALK and LTK ligand 1 isoform X1 n=1 Tax=Bufo bufo TaxID=8384 RepID=UPI001ABDAD6B|nr:ALK and LTK ligand 1 isoform X1 [Bufo bufo]